MTEFKRHPMSEIYPKMNPGDFGLLVESIRDNGFDPAFPIYTFEGQIIDGWHRYQAAKEVGVDPIIDEWPGSEADILGFVVRANGSRRHLTGAARVQALLKVKLLRGGAPENGGKTPLLNDQEVGAFAQQAGVSPSQVRIQERLRRADPDVADKVASGEMKGDTARRKVLKEQPNKQAFVHVQRFGVRLTEKIDLHASEVGETMNAFVHRVA